MISHFDKNVVVVVKKNTFSLVNLVCKILLELCLILIKFAE